LYNNLSDDNDSCTMVLAEGSPCLTQGEIISGPTEVESWGRKEGNAGIYRNAAVGGARDVRGAVGYILPGINSSILVIYFDAEQCQMLFVDHGTIVDSKIVEKVKADGSAWQSGGFVLAQAGSATFQVCQKHQLGSARTHGDRSL
jgi:hypothetical protein